MVYGFELCSHTEFSGYARPAAGSGVLGTADVERYLTPGRAAGGRRGAGIFAGLGLGAAAAGPH